MKVPCRTALAYHETCKVVVRTLPQRLIVSAIMTTAVVVYADLAAGLVWWSALALLLWAETLAYRRFFADPDAPATWRLRAVIGLLACATSLVYAFPAWPLVMHGSSGAGFAAAAFLAGGLVNLTVYNANSSLIFLSAAGPMTVNFLALSFFIAGRESSFIPVLTVVTFLGALGVAYTARAKNLLAIQATAASALRERAKAAAANEAKSRFLANMSHELRTPLNGVIGMAEVVRNGPLNDDQRAQLDIIIGSGETLLAHLNDILDHAKIEAGGVSLQPVAEDFGDIVVQSASLFHPLARKKDVVLSFDTSGVEVRKVRIDGRRLRQCLTNLLSNAVKFTDSGAVLVKARAYALPPAVEGKGGVEGGAATKAAALEIEVSDTGIGMTPEQSARVFDAFEQADDSITRRFGGAGLGLSVCRAIVETMGGEIAVRSAPGVGSTFSIHLTAPLVAERAAVPERAAAAGREAFAGAAPAEATSAHGLREEYQEYHMYRDKDGERAQPDRGQPGEARANDPAALVVLLVEDNEINRKVASAMLTARGAEVVEAVNGREGLARLAERPVDIVLMDIHMPVMDGYEAMRAIRASGAPYADVPMAALTAAAAAEDAEACRAAGADAVLTKPLRGAALDEVLAPVRARRAAA